MTSKRKRMSNRLNAMKSTGPRTPAGKARSSQNAIKHGFFARATLLPQEDRALFTDFARAMRHDLMPVGALEEVYAAQIIVGAWRMQRQARIEAGVFSEFLENGRQAMKYNNGKRYDPNYPMVFAESEVGVWGHAFTFYNGKGEPFEKLMRYQTLVSREFHRAVRDLQRLQAVRPPRTYDDWLQQQPDDNDDADTPDLLIVQNEPIQEKLIAESRKLTASNQNEPISSFIPPPSSFQNEPTDLKTAPSSGSQSLDNSITGSLDYSPTDHQPPTTGHQQQNEPISSFNLPPSAFQKAPPPGSGG
ncbi:MAG: hypothetical protein ACYC7E_19315, partial [Armatimonadota bacterium]